jgi:hypothetical protein
MPPIICDGCGQSASSEHTARRLQRLEWSTRYRPIHLQTLLLGAVSPVKDTEFLYSPAESHAREAASIFAAAGIDTAGKSTEALHAEFHRRGIFLTYVLECPFEAESAGGARVDPVSALMGSLRSRLPALFTRIRRSLKPKRIVPISGALAPLLQDFANAQLGCELLLEDGHPFALDSTDSTAAKQSLSDLQGILSAPTAR